MATEEVGIKLSVRGRREAARALADTADDIGKIDKKLDGIDGSARRAERGIDRAAEAGNRFGRKIARGVAIGAAALVGIGYGAGRLAIGFIKDAQESAKISRLTDAAIKSTGGVANVTADQIGKLSESISNKSALDDEMIQGGANLLLTFTKVRNEVGKGNNIFDQATQAATDMSVALGTDLDSAAIQLGKALNDPIKGVTALSKSGVSFTEQQKDQIKQMVKAGDVLGAQKVILKEMSVQFGGAAEAAADPLDRLRVIAGNMGERIGGVLLPHVERFSNFLILSAVPVFERFMDQFDRGIGTGGALRDRLGELRDVGVRLWEEFRTGTGTGGELRDALATAGDAAKILGETTRDVILPAIAWFNDHPDALAGLVAGMTAFKIQAQLAASATATIAAASALGIGGKAGAAGAAGGAASKGGKLGKAVRGAGLIGAVEGVRRATDTPWHDIFGLTESEKDMIGRLNPFDGGSSSGAVPQLHPAVSIPAPVLPVRSGSDVRQPIVVQSVLDGRVISETVIDDIHSREARR
jgi:hypothetical protein